MGRNHNEGKSCGYDFRNVKGTDRLEQPWRQRRYPVSGEFVARSSPRRLPTKSRTEYGAYKFPRQRNYWIPGPQHLTKATTPLPANEASDVPSDVDLKWQVCREGCTYDVYFGSDINDLELVAGQIGHNVVRLSSDLEVGLTYYWRVDTQHGLGEVWEFTVGPDFVYDPS